MKVAGDGWLKSSVDIVIAGLGWVTVTGVGQCTVRVRVPEGTTVGTRPALLPFESKSSTGKFSGGRIVRRSAKRGAKAKASGWRKQ